jgi:hypothetical protein
MSTMFATAVGAIVSALNAGTPVATQVARVRLRPMAQATGTAAIVRPLSTEVVETALYPGQPVSWTTVISVECYARSSAATTPDIAVDSLVSDVYARLMADTTLGGVVLALQPQSIAWDFDADGENTTCATLLFNARHRSPGATLS